MDFYLGKTYRALTLDNFVLVLLKKCSSLNFSRAQETISSFQPNFWEIELEDNLV